MYKGRKSKAPTDAIQALNDFVDKNKKKNICLTSLDGEGGFDYLNLNRIYNKIREQNTQYTWHHGSRIRGATNKQPTGSTAEPREPSEQT